MSLRHVGQGRFPLFEWGWLWSQDVMHLRQKKWPHCRQGGQRATLTRQVSGSRRSGHDAAPAARRHPRRGTHKRERGGGTCLGHHRVRHDVHANDALQAHPFAGPGACPGPGPSPSRRARPSSPSLPVHAGDHRPVTRVPKFPTGSFLAVAGRGTDLVRPPPPRLAPRHVGDDQLLVVAVVVARGGILARQVDHEPRHGTPRARRPRPTLLPVRCCPRGPPRWRLARTERAPPWGLGRRLPLPPRVGLSPLPPAVPPAVLPSGLAHHVAARWRVHRGIEPLVVPHLLPCPIRRHVCRQPPLPSLLLQSGSGAPPTGATSLEIVAPAQVHWPPRSRGGPSPRTRCAAPSGAPVVGVRGRPVAPPRLGPDATGTVLRPCPERLARIAGVRSTRVRRPDFRPLV